MDARLETTQKIVSMLSFWLFLKREGSCGGQKRNIGMCFHIRLLDIDVCQQRCNKEMDISEICKPAGGCCRQITLKSLGFRQELPSDHSCRYLFTNKQKKTRNWGKKWIPEAVLRCEIRPFLFVKNGSAKTPVKASSHTSPGGRAVSCIAFFKT